MFYVQSKNNSMNYKRDTEGLSVVYKPIIEIYEDIIIYHLKLTFLLSPNLLFFVSFLGKNSFNFN